jgi:hypothetical protein
VGDVAPMSGNAPREEKPMVSATVATGMSSALPPQTWQAYFKRFGCVRCERNDVPHDHDGFCKPCRELVVIQLKHIRKGR